MLHRNVNHCNVMSTYKPVLDISDCIQSRMIARDWPVQIVYRAALICLLEALVF